MSLITLLDTSTPLEECAAELQCSVEQLLTPLTRFTRQHPTARFAIDNGAFARFDSHAFLALLAREWSSRHLCRFVAIPDVVGSAQRTMELFEYWYPRLSGWPLALVAQDGIESMPIPWRSISTIFIGGSTAWKLGPHAAAVIKAAKAMDKWVHVGRVNTPGRFEYFEALGADSVDGSGLARFSHMREAIATRANNLFANGAHA